MESMKLLIGGSPCTYWSIAQTSHRETEASGMGWELFKNYLIARDKYKPDYFLYENNKSMSAAIRAQITREFGFEPVLINSALVSAQNRQRLYWVGKREPDGTYSKVDVEQPEDRGILLRDILETGVCWREKSYTLDANYYKTAGIYNPKKQHSYSRLMAAEPVGITADGKAYALKAQYYKSSTANFLNGGGHFPQTGAAVPAPTKELKVGVFPNGRGELTQCQSKRIYSTDAKGRVLNAGPGGLGVQTGLYAVPAPIEYNPLNSCNVVVTDQNIRCTYKDGSGTAQGYSVYFDDVKSPSVIAGHAHKMKVIERATGKEHPIYEVRNGLITIKDKQYPIKLADGYYIIRKLTVKECMRLQTVPEWYVFPVSDTQAYKMLGNGWTVEVIAHIMSHFDGLTERPVEVLSMYDGMSCGHLALDKLGANVSRYYATEIDKYAIQTTQANFPDTVQLGDAFQVRDDEWTL